MARVAYHTHSPKETFEQEVANQIGTITCELHNQSRFDSPPPEMNLYYKDGVHVGTWTRGVGWLFDSAFQLPKS